MANSIVKHDWNGHEISQRSTDGYVNLTDMCKATGYPVEMFSKTQEYLEVALFLYQEQIETVVKHPMEFENQEIWADLDLCGFYARNAANYNSKNYPFLFWFNRTLLLPLGEDFSLIGKAFGDALTKSSGANLQRLYAIKSTDALYASNDEKSHVYFILNKRRKQVKIGFSKNPEARLRSFSAVCSEKLEIALTFSGGIKTERLVHSYFSDCRIGKSELFRYEGKLKDFLDGKISIQFDGFNFELDSK